MCLDLRYELGDSARRRIVTRKCNQELRARSLPTAASTTIYVARKQDVPLMKAWLRRTIHGVTGFQGRTGSWLFRKTRILVKSPKIVRWMRNGISSAKYYDLDSVDRLTDSEKQWFLQGKDLHPWPGSSQTPVPLSATELHEEYLRSLLTWCHTARLSRQERVRVRRRPDTLPLPAPQIEKSPSDKPFSTPSLLPSYTPRTVPWRFLTIRAHRKPGSEALRVWAYPWWMDFGSVDGNVNSLPLRWLRRSSVVGSALPSLHISVSWREKLRNGRKRSQHAFISHANLSAGGNSA